MTLKYGSLLPPSKQVPTSWYSGCYSNLEKKEITLRISGTLLSSIAVAGGIFAILSLNTTPQDSRRFFACVTLITSGAYGMVNSIVPRKYIRDAEIYLADFSFEIFEIITQISVNLTQTQTVKLAFYCVYNALGTFYSLSGGLQLTTMPVKYEAKQITTYEVNLEIAPLLDGADVIVEEYDKLTIQRKAVEERMNVLKDWFKELVESNDGKKIDTPGWAVGAYQRKMKSYNPVDILTRHEFRVCMREIMCYEQYFIHHQTHGRDSHTPCR